jgi:hypothetical protein
MKSLGTHGSTTAGWKSSKRMARMSEVLGSVSESANVNGMPSWFPDIYYPSVGDF